MKITENKVVYEGLVEVNPFGNWSDVDHGIYIDDDNITNLLDNYEGKKIRITIEEI